MNDKHVLKHKPINCLQKEI